MKLAFLMSLLFLSWTYALPFQEPVVGKYACVASQEDAFDINAEDIGATLEILNTTTYRFSTASATEEGTVSSYTFESGEAIFDALWQSASVLTLQPGSGVAPYEGAFFMDHFGEIYIVIQTNTGVYIRCQSEGADLAAVLGSSQTANHDTNQNSVPTRSSDTLQPLQSLRTGVYTCVHTNELTFWASTDDPSYYPDDDPDYFATLFFDDGAILNIEAKDVFNSGYEKGRYSFDAAQSKVSIEGGNLGGLRLSYGINEKGVPALSYIFTEREDGGTDKEQVWTYSCEYSEAIPAGMNVAGFENDTPVVDFGRVLVVASVFDASNPDPKQIPMTDTYYCYPNFDVLDVGEGYPRYVREYKLEILPDYRYSLNGQQGSFATGVEGYYLQWQSGPLNPTGDIIKGQDDVIVPHNSNVNFDAWGSEIMGVDIPLEDRTATVDCFQQGPREQKALLDFALKLPSPASYTCLPSGDNPQATGLEILPDNRYRFDDKEGSYRSSVNEYGTTMIWESGPLTGSDTSYNADDETGLRDIRFTTSQTFMGGGIPAGSATTQTMACQAVLQANLIPEYATTTITPPPAGAGGLNGFYARAEFDPGDILGGVAPVTNWYYYHFLPDGYVYQDGYAIGDECRKTYPNGIPVCKGYSYNNNQIIFTDSTSIGVLAADEGNLLFDSVLFENKTLSGPQPLLGTFEYATAYSSPMYMQIAGMGTNAFYTDTYTFLTNGRYTFTSDSYSQTSAPALDGSPMGTIGALSSSGSSESDSGNYTIDGNLITFNSDRGYTTQCGFFFPVKGDMTRVNICGTDYDPPSGE